MIKPRVLCLIISVLLIIQTKAADRFWIGASNNNWNETGNWSTSSGGVGGASVPGASDRVYFDGNGNVNCVFDMAPTIASIDLASTFTATIDLNGNNLIISGTDDNDFESGTIDNTSGGSISLNTTGRTDFRGTLFNPDITVSSGRIFLSGSRFNGSASFTKTGTGTDVGTGNCVFAAGLTLINTSSDQFRTATSNPDSVIGNLTLTNTGSSYIFYAFNSAGNYVSGNVTINSNGSSGNAYINLIYAAAASLTVGGDVQINQIGSASNNYVYLCDRGTLTIGGTTSIAHSGGANNHYTYISVETTASVTFSDSISIENSTTTATVSNVYLGYSGDVTCASFVQLVNSSTATTHQVVVAQGSNSSVIFSDALLIANSGSGTTGRVFLGYNGDITCNGTVSISNADASTNSEIFVNYGSNSSGTFNQNITLENTNAASDGIRFGEGGGNCALAASRTISLGSGGFTTGTLTLRNFTQSGGTAQTLALTGTAYLNIYDADWGGNVVFSAPRITTRGTRYRGTTDITKTGASNDGSAGGNVYDGNASFTNSGTNYLLLGNGTPDTFALNLTLVNSGSDGLYLAYNSAGNYIGGDLTATVSGTGTNSLINLSDNTNASLEIAGNLSVSVAGTATTCQARVGQSGDVNIGGNLAITNTSGSTNSYVYVATNTSSEVIISGTLTYTQSGGGTNVVGYIGYNGDVTVSGITTLTNNASATSSIIHTGFGANANALFNHNIILQSTHASSDGIHFGNNGGATVLAATRTISIGGSGFTAGDIYLRNFTQTGATPQSLAPSTSGYIYLYDSQWGDATSFSAGRILLRGSNFGGNCTLTKTGATDDLSAGGNTFSSHLTLNNSGSGYFLMSYTNPDSISGNLIMNNSGTDDLHFAYRATGNYIAGNVTMNNTASGASNTNVRLCNDSSSTLLIGGNLTLINACTSTGSYAYIGVNGDVTISGDFTGTHSATGTNGYLVLANGTYSTVEIGGNTILTNSATGTTAHQIIGGENGDVIFTGTLTLTNTSTAATNDFRMNNQSNSSNTYSGNITVNSTGSSDGIDFGQGGGSGTLAATRTITVGGSGFSAGDLYFRNFTQVGATAQTLINSGTGYIYNYDCNWGGNVVFSGGRHYTRGTTYQGTANLSKTGASDDASAGGNTFAGDVVLSNSGSGYFGMGNGTADSFGGNLTMTNSGSSTMYLAQNSAGNTITGNLAATNSASAGTSYLYISNAAASTLSVGGNATITNNGTTADCRLYFGNSGDISITGNLTATNSASGNIGQIQIADASTSEVTIGGTCSVSNSGTGTYKRVFLGVNGDMIFGGQLTISNSATATNSEIHCNYGSSSANTYSGNIVVESTHASSDGIRFGDQSGTGTLAATRTITVGGGGFIGGDLYFRNFTQVGATPQTLVNSGTGYIYNYDCNWGGNVSFSGGRYYTRGTTYQGTATLLKTNASDDASAGGNSFLGDATLTNSGSGYFGMGNGTADTYGGNLTVNNSGTSSFYIGLNSAGNSIAGNLVVNNQGSGTNNNIYLSNSASSSLSVTGTTALTNSSTATNSYIFLGESGDVTLGNNLTLTNNGTGTNGYIYLSNSSTSLATVNGNITATNSAASGSTKTIYLGNVGDMDINGTLDVTNSSNATTAEVYVASNANSEVDVLGAATFANSGSGTTTRIYVGSSGDITFQNTISLSTSSPSANADIRCNYNTGSAGVYSGNITLEATHASSDGISFGLSGGTGTLAATRTLLIGGGGFISGDLMLRNFTQGGSVAINLTLSGAARYYPYDAALGGNVTVTTPSYYSRGTTYGGAFSLNYNGTGNSDSYGGNTFNGDVAYNLSGTGRLRLANNVANDYNADVSFTRTVGTLQPAYNQASTFAGDITVDCNTEVTMGANNGSVVIDGSTNQNFNDGGTTSDFTFRRLTVNKSGGSFTLNEPLNIQTSVTFTSGVINTDVVNLLIIEDDATVTDASDASFVDGPLDKIGNGTNPFVFPVGDSGSYRPITMTTPGNTARFRGQYLRVNPTSLYDWMSKEAGVNHVSTREYWTLDRIAGTDAETITLGWDANSGGVDNLSDLIVVRWDGTQWRNHGNGGTTGNITSGTVQTSGNVSSFSPFTLGSSTTNNPLPVSLMYFNAEILQEKMQTLLRWSTSSEINNRFFTLERAGDDGVFAVIAELDGQGTTNKRTDYRFFDTSPKQGNNYYRLSQTDINGNREYFEIEKVWFGIENQAQNSSLTLFPNPSNGRLLHLSFSDIPTGPVSVGITDVAGKAHAASLLPVSNNQKASFDIQMQQTLAPGAYFLHLWQGAQRTVLPFMVR
jgi:hypothetical protein